MSRDPAPMLHPPVRQLDQIADQLWEREIERRTSRVAARSRRYQERRPTTAIAALSNADAAVIASFPMKVQNVADQTISVQLLHTLAVLPRGSAATERERTNSD